MLRRGLDTSARMLGLVTRLRERVRRLPIGPLAERGAHPSVDRTLESLRDLVSQPSQNFAAVGTAISIIVVFVIIIVLILIAAALPSRTHDAAKHEASASDADPVPRRRRRVPRWLAMLILGTLTLVGLLGAMALWYDSTSNDAYCTSTCHAMAEPTRTWASSAHRNVECIRCHEGRRWESWPQGVAGRSHSLYLQVTGRRSGSRPVDEATCLDCHGGLLSTPLEARNGETFTHGVLLKDGRSCISCHGAQGHEVER